MTRISAQTRAQARHLRANMTPQERHIWQALRDLNLRIGTRFRRQAAIGPYIADFADYGRRLVIELDGSQHGKFAQAERDARRDEFLAGQGFTVLRFWNSDVNANPDGVLQYILDAVEAGPRPSPPPPTPPHEGEGSRQELEPTRSLPLVRRAGEGGAPSRDKDQSP